MFRALRNAWRLLGMALSLARHDALFPLEALGIAPAVVACAKVAKQGEVTEAMGRA